MPVQSSSSNFSLACCDYPVTDNKGSIQTSFIVVVVSQLAVYKALDCTFKDATEKGAEFEILSL